MSSASLTHPWLIIKLVLELYCPSSVARVSVDTVQNMAAGECTKIKNLINYPRSSVSQSYSFTAGGFAVCFFTARLTHFLFVYFSFGVMSYGIVCICCFILHIWTKQTDFHLIIPSSRILIASQPKGNLKKRHKLKSLPYCR